MSYRIIVVHLDDGARCAARTSIAIDLAARFGSRLVGVSPTGLPDVIVGMNSAVPDSVECVALTAAALREHAEAVAKMFEDRCVASRVGSFESRVVVDETADAIVRHGQCSDLVIVGQGDWEAPVDGVAMDLAQQVLLHAGTPVLVIPHAGSFASIGQRPLIAWKEKPEATRALRDALPILQGAERVVVCTVGEGGTKDIAPGRLEAVCLWLGTHGVRVDVRHAGQTADVGDRLLSLAADVGADLIVAGGYGHSRLRESILGGVTRHLLEHTTLPTLLSH